MWVHSESHEHETEVCTHFQAQKFTRIHRETAKQTLNSFLAGSHGWKFRNPKPTIDEQTKENVHFDAEQWTKIFIIV